MQSSGAISRGIKNLATKFPTTMGVYSRTLYQKVKVRTCSCPFRDPFRSPPPERSKKMASLLGVHVLRVGLRSRTVLQPVLLQSRRRVSQLSSQGNLNWMIAAGVGIAGVTSFMVSRALHCGVDYFRDAAIDCIPQFFLYFYDRLSKLIISQPIIGKMAALTVISECNRTYLLRR